ncbi:P27 family phage terminase small subunit [Nocardia terpenica]|uniref:Phage terminase small subunit P27 family n=1 Tax=Nocardia terpenica TaxID=455432 RepID=A0A164H2I8_9NOCA|nr:P27 family phage terminase small subunit [Nocardia terpenica]KZM68144.1 hypothetical protein AWN90_09390 [Nocardia terpenica]NQE88997.1 hypothetical protein [Nocardia terpenica]
MTAADFPVIPLRRASQTPMAASTGAPEPPEWLTELGRQVWQQLASRIELTPTALGEFACYCEALAEFQESTQLLSETGLLIVDANGAPVLNPISAVRDRADRKIAAWAARFRT